MSTVGSPVKLTIGNVQTFVLGGTALDNIEGIKVSSSNSAIAWSASIGSGQTASAVTVLATPTLVSGAIMPSGEDQVVLSPVGSGYHLSDNFHVNGFGPIHCTITSGGAVYSAGQQLAVAAQYQPNNPH